MIRLDFREHLFHSWTVCIHKWTSKNGLNTTTSGSFRADVSVYEVKSFVSGFLEPYHSHKMLYFYYTDSLESSVRNGKCTHLLIVVANPSFLLKNCMKDSYFAIELMREWATIQAVLSVTDPVLITSKSPSALMGCFDVGLSNKLTRLKLYATVQIAYPFSIDAVPLEVARR